MKILVFADPHISLNGEFSKPTSDGLSDYLHKIINSFVWLCKLVEEQKPDAVVCLGDLFESTGFIDTVSLHVASELCNDLIGLCDYMGITAYFLVGNHDIYASEHNIHNLAFLKSNLNNSVVIDRPKKITMMDEISAFFHPWADEFTLPPSSSDICFLHLDVVGGYLHKNTKSKFGVSPGMFKCISFNGHHHNPNMPGKQFYNIGALLSRDFRDVDSDPRGATIVNLGKENTVEFFPNPIDIPFKDAVIHDFNYTEIQNLVDSGLSGYEECFVRIKYREKYKELAEDLGYLTKGARLEVIPAISKSDVEKDEDGYNLARDSFSPTKCLTKYIDDVFIFDNEEDEKEARKLGEEYINKIKSNINNHNAPIKITRVVINNFHNIEHVDITFPGGIIYISGPNGSGKSSIHEAIYWCTTGKSLRGYVGDDVVRWGKDECVVTQYIGIGDGNYIISRGRKPKLLSITQITDEGDYDISCRRDTDTQTKIQELIGRSVEIFRQSVFLTSDLNMRFTSLAYPDRIRLIEYIVNMETYLEAEKLINSDLKKGNVTKATLTGSISSWNDTLKNAQNSLQKINGEIVEQSREMNVDVTQAKEDLKKLIEDRDELSNNMKLIVDKSKGGSDKLEVMDKEKWAIQEKRNAVDSKMSWIRAEVLSLGSDIKERNKLIVAGKCPTCMSDIDMNSKLYGVIEEKQKELKKHENNLSILAKERQSFEITVREINSGIVELKSSMKELAEKRDALGQEQNGIEKEIGLVKAKIKSIRKDDSALTAKRDAMHELIDRTRKNIDEHEGQKKKVEDEIRVLEFLSMAFSTTGIRSKVLSDIIIPFLNNKISMYSEVFDIPFHLSAEKETKKGTIISRIDPVLHNEKKYEGCSRGERRKIDLSIQCALRDLAEATGGGDIDLLVCDEIIDPLDDDSVEAFVRILRMMIENKDMNALVVSHKPNIESLFRTRWRIYNNNGAAYLAEESHG